MIDGFQFRHGGQTPAAPGHGETLHPGLGLVKFVVRVGVHIPIKAGDAVGDNPIIGFGKSRLDSCRPPPGPPGNCSCRNPHTTNKIKAIRPKRYHRAMFNPPAVNWGKIIITLAFLPRPTGSLAADWRQDDVRAITFRLWLRFAHSLSPSPFPPKSTPSPASWRR